MRVFFLFFTFAIFQLSFAEEQIQPHIDALKKKHGITSRPWSTETIPETPESKARVLKEDLSDSKQVQPYIESLKKRETLKEEAEAEPTDRRVQPHIDSLRAGKVLEPKFREKIRHAIGVSLMAKSMFTVSSDEKTQANDFAKIYKTDEKWNPGADLFYEYQFIRDRWGGALGLATHLSVVALKGTAQFTKRKAPANVQTRFFAFPVSVGLGYRLLLFHYLVPYGHAAGVWIPFMETRSDRSEERKGFSEGLQFTAGLALNIDWISRKSQWEQHNAQRIVHTYIMAEVQRLQTLMGIVKFDYTGFYGGLSFEY